jgi:hypothetical protein
VPVQTFCHSLPKKRKYSAQVPEWAWPREHYLSTSQAPGWQTHKIQSSHHLPDHYKDRLAFTSTVCLLTASYIVCPGNLGSILSPHLPLKTHLGVLSSLQALSLCPEILILLRTGPEGPCKPGWFFSILQLPWGQERYPMTTTLRHTMSCVSWFPILSLFVPDDHWAFALSFLWLAESYSSFKSPHKPHFLWMPPGIRWMPLFGLRCLSPFHLVLLS